MNRNDGIDEAAALPAVLPVSIGPRAVGRLGWATAIVPTHNDGANIAPLLRVLLDEPDVGEILVVASACTDGTVSTVLEIAAQGDDRISLFVEGERSGKAAAINFALTEASLPYVVVVSGDVLPTPGAVGQLLKALRPAGVGMSGGRPVPVNDDGTPVGYAVHLLWRLHHRMALDTPKLGEMVALKAKAAVSLPKTAVDEACFQALVEAEGWTCAYVPDAVVANRGPNSVRDFVLGRRRVHGGHLWLRHKLGYTVPSLHPGFLVRELWHDLVSDRQRLQPQRLAWTGAAIAMEACGRLLARVDYLRGREDHVWKMVKSAKAPAPDADRVLAGGGPVMAGAGLAAAAADQRHDQRQLPL
jgi:biofilm PGA synthesis N-glycosyltransferase PgaC